MFGCRRPSILVALCTTAAALVAPASASAERRVYLTIKSVTGVYHSEYDIPRGVAPHESDRCFTTYRSERGREDVTMRTLRPVNAVAVYDTRARPKHWRMTRGGPLRYPTVQTLSREKHGSRESVAIGCGVQGSSETYDCGGSEVYRFDRPLGIGLTVGPHTVRNHFDVDNWLGTTPQYVPQNHPLHECEVPSVLRSPLRLKGGMWKIGRGDWKRRTLEFDRTVVDEICIGASDPAEYIIAPPGPPCGTITTRAAWTVKIVRRPDPRNR